MDVDKQSCKVEFESVDDVKNARSAVRRLATFAVEDGVPGVKAA